MMIELEPGRAAGLTRHPCPVVGYGAARTIQLQIRGATVHLLQPADGCCAPPGYAPRAARPELHAPG